MNQESTKLIHVIIDEHREYFEKIVEYIKNYQSKKRNIKKYVLAFEVSKKTGKKHFHCTFETTVPITTIRRNFKEHFKDVLNSVATVKNPSTVFLYTVKDGDVVAHNYPQEEVDKWRESSYEKPQNNLKEARNFYSSMKKHILKQEVGLDKRKIGLAILKYYHDKCKCFPFDRQLKQYIESIYYAHLNRTETKNTADKELHSILDRVLF